MTHHATDDRFRKKFRELQRLWIDANRLQNGPSGERRRGDEIHCRALALENHLVDTLGHIQRYADQIPECGPIRAVLAEAAR